ncbi:hypothetical protein ACH4OW_31730 [Streptomyces sp. NPDC017056]|uniref:hypothetical protein n=1 Tax=Streptomyces sp. NPDC017056 TaxID=3364973 RepID=UPI0037AC7AF4
MEIDKESTQAAFASRQAMTSLTPIRRERTRRDTVTAGNVTGILEGSFRMRKLLLKGMKRSSVPHTPYPARPRRAGALFVLLSMVAAVTLTGCSGMSAPGREAGPPPDSREVSAAKSEAQSISIEILSIIGLRGKTSKPGPGVAVCGDRDPGKFYAIHHHWSLTGVPVSYMKKAMKRLREGLPGKDWAITSYGPDSSPSKSLELTADSVKEKYSVSIRLLDGTGRTEPGAPTALIYVDLTSACFQAPKGKTVHEY